MNKKVAQQKVVGQLPTNETDYRFIPFGAVCIYFFLLLYAEFYWGSYAIITDLFNILPKPYFIDLKILLCGIDSVRAGADPYTTVCVEGVSLFNYPYVWTFLSYFPFLNSANHISIGLVLVGMVFTGLYFFVGKINFRAAVIYLFLFLSPAIVLGLERGNCDLVIFLLFLLPIFFHKHSKLLGIVVLLASILKLFPIGGLAGILNTSGSKLKKAIGIIAIVITMFALYLIIMKDNILLISEKTPRPFLDISYGLGQMPSIAVHFLNINPKWSSLIYAIFVVACIILFVLNYPRVLKKTAIPVIDSGRDGVAYLIGSGIFITTCFIGHNYEYRLMFLIFTIPQLMIWYTENRKIALGFMTLSVLIFWQTSLSYLLAKIGQMLTFNSLPSSLFVVLGYMVFKVVLIILLFFHLLVMVKFLSDFLGNMLKPTLRTKV